MDKDTITRIVGELYINNILLTQQNAALVAEVEQLRKLLDQLGGN
jgi:hypothetical protein